MDVTPTLKESAPKSKRAKRNTGNHPCGRKGCEKRFTREKDAKRHQDTHDPSTRRQHACNVSDCEFASRQKSNLTKHQLQLHGILPPFPGPRKRKREPSEDKFDVVPKLVKNQHCRTLVEPSPIITLPTLPVELAFFANQTCQRPVKSAGPALPYVIDPPSSLYGDVHRSYQVNTFYWTDAAYGTANSHFEAGIQSNTGYIYKGYEGASGYSSNLTYPFYFN